MIQIHAEEKRNVAWSRNFVEFYEWDMRKMLCWRRYQLELERLTKRNEDLRRPNGWIANLSYVFPLTITRQRATQCTCEFSSLLIRTNSPVHLEVTTGKHIKALAQQVVKPFCPDRNLMYVYISLTLRTNLTNDNFQKNEMYFIETIPPISLKIEWRFMLFVYVVCIYSLYWFFYSNHSFDVNNLKSFPNVKLLHFPLFIIYVRKFAIVYITLCSNNFFLSKSTLFARIDLVSF